MKDLDVAFWMVAELRLKVRSTSAENTVARVAEKSTLAKDSFLHLIFSMDPIH